MAFCLRIKYLCKKKTIKKKWKKLKNSILIYDHLHGRWKRETKERRKKTMCKWTYLFCMEDGENGLFEHFKSSVRTTYSCTTINAILKRMQCFESNWILLVNIIIQRKLKNRFFFFATREWIVMYKMLNNC